MPMPRGPRPGGGQRRQGGAPAEVREVARDVWVLEAGKPVAVKVTTGISDGRMTEVHGEALKPGMAVITDQRSGSAQ
ncbi:hypothetical protein D3C80_1752290 [compost metagenome]